MFNENTHLTTNQIEWALIKLNARTGAAASSSKHLNAEQIVSSSDFERIRINRV